MKTGIIMTKRSFYSSTIEEFCDEDSYKDYAGIYYSENGETCRHSPSL